MSDKILDSIELASSQEAERPTNGYEAWKKANKEGKPDYSHIELQSYEETQKPVPIVEYALSDAIRDQITKVIKKALFFRTNFSEKHNPEKLTYNNMRGDINTRYQNKDILPDDTIKTIHAMLEEEITNTLGQGVWGKFLEQLQECAHLGNSLFILHNSPGTGRFKQVAFDSKEMPIQEAWMEVMIELAKTRIDLRNHDNNGLRFSYGSPKKSAGEAKKEANDPTKGGFGTGAVFPDHVDGSATTGNVPFMRIEQYFTAVDRNPDIMKNPAAYAEYKQALINIIRQSHLETNASNRITSDIEQQKPGAKFAPMFQYMRTTFNVGSSKVEYVDGRYTGLEQFDEVAERSAIEDRGYALGSTVKIGDKIMPQNYIEQEENGQPVKYKIPDEEYDFASASPPETLVFYGVQQIAPKAQGGDRRKEDEYKPLDTIWYDLEKLESILRQKKYSDVYHALQQNWFVHTSSKVSGAQSQKDEQRYYYETVKPVISKQNTTYGSRTVWTMNYTEDPKHPERNRMRVRDDLTGNEQEQAEQAINTLKELFGKADTLGFKHEKSITTPGSMVFLPKTHNRPRMFIPNPEEALRRAFKRVYTASLGNRIVASLTDSAVGFARHKSDDVEQCMPGSGRIEQPVEGANLIKEPRNPWHAGCHVAAIQAEKEKTNRPESLGL